MTTERSFHLHYGLTDAAPHGNNRRPGPGRRRTLDLRELARWNARQRAAINAYRAARQREAEMEVLEHIQGLRWDR